MAGFEGFGEFGTEGLVAADDVDEACADVAGAGREFVGRGLLFFGELGFGLGKRTWAKQLVVFADLRFRAWHRRTLVRRT